MTGGTYVREPVRISARTGVPDRLLDHEAVRFRRELASKGIPCADSYLLYADGRTRDISTDAIPGDRGGGDATAYSVSLLGDGSEHGSGRDSQTPADFADRVTLEDFLDRCQRYRCRSFSTSETLADDVAAVVSDAPTTAPVPVLVQELRDPQYSGIVHRTGDRLHVELTRGSFVTKGATATSRYAFSPSYELLDRSLATQSVSYAAIDGYVVERRLPPSERTVELPAATLGGLLEELRVGDLETAGAIEFGIETRDGDHRPYVIDRVDDGGSMATRTASAFTSDVISPGSVTGVARSAADVTDESVDAGESVVVHHEKPDIALLSTLDRLPADEVGFVFETGSTLCHLSTVLRERGVPAVVLPADHDVAPGDRLTIRAAADRSWVIAR